MNHPTTVIRAIKLSSWSKIGSSAGHTWRTITVSHADSSRTYLNENWLAVSSPEDLRAAAEKRIALAENLKKSSVLLIEYVVSSNHDAFIENGGIVSWREYFKDALKFFEDKHGKENIVGVNVQLDEHTPHLVIYAVPLVNYPAHTRQRNIITGKKNGETTRGYRTYNIPPRTYLSASYFVGSREKLRSLQTDFANKVGIKHGLQRGLRHSEATYVTTKNFHQALKRGLAENINLSIEELSKKGSIINKESNESYVNRISKMITEHYNPVIAKASLYEVAKKRATEMAETARRAQAELLTEKENHLNTKTFLHRLTAGLSDNELRKLQKITDNIRESKELFKKEQEMRKRQEKLAEERHQKLQIEKKAFEIRMISARQLATLSRHERQSIWRFTVTRT